MSDLNLFFLLFGTNNKSVFFNTLMIIGAEYSIYFSIALMFILFFRGKLLEKKAFILSLFSIVITIALIKFIHIFFFEPRPFVSYNITPLISSNEDASFPSRHTAIVSTIAFAFIFYKSKWAYLFTAFLVLTGIGRMYVGVHYPLDIVGGILIGAISILIGIYSRRFLIGAFS